MDGRISAIMDSAGYYKSIGKEEISMKMYAETEEMVGNSTPDSLKGMLFFSIAEIYNDALMAYDYAGKYYGKASDCFKAGGDTSMWAISQLKIAELLISGGEYGRASGILDSLCNSGLRDSVALMCEAMAARNAALCGKEADARRLISEYVAQCAPEATDWLLVAEVLLELGDTLSGKAVLDSASVYVGLSGNNPLYCRLLSGIQSFEGKDEAALATYKRYVSIKDSLELKARLSGAKYISEQHAQDLAMERYRGAIMIVLASIMLLAVAVVFIVVVLKRSKKESVVLYKADKEAKSRISDLQKEMDVFKNILKYRLGDSPELRKIVSERLLLLETCMAGVLTTGSSRTVKIEEMIDSVKSDREKFQESLRLTFGITNPKFISYLEEKGLTREQIHICCLYAIGMTGKEIMAYTEKKRTYNMSSEIRSRLGLNMHDTNLGKHLRNLMRTLCVAALFAVIGCEDHGAVYMRLERAGSMMNADPQGALAVLDSINKDELSTRRLNAEYALLLSMAYDKNEIDVTSDSLVRVAYDYYRYFGSKDDKLKAYYYLGNAYLCMYDYEKAIETFLKAEKLAGKVKDKTALALLYNTSAYIYVKIKDPKSIDYYRKSADAFYAAGDTNRAVRSLLYRSIVCDAVGADSIENATFREIEDMKDRVDKEYLHQYYGIKISKAVSEGDRSAVKDILDTYFSIYDESDVDWANVAEAQVCLGMFREAEQSLGKFRKRFPSKRLDVEYTFYHSRLATVYDSMKLYKRSLQEYQRYVELSDSIARIDLASDTKYLKDRNRNELELRRFRNRVIVLSILGVAIVILVAGLAHMYVLRRRNNKALKSELERDRERLAEMQKELERLQKESSNADEDAINFITRQLEILNSFIAKSIVYGKGYVGKGIMSEIEKLANDRDSFLDSLYETFTLTHPDFIKTLDGHGLTKEEKFICCLYAIGLQGKDIMAYLGRKRHYVDSSVIRAKLGLSEHDVNLGRYIRSICQGAEA